MEDKFCLEKYSVDMFCCRKKSISRANFVQCRGSWRGLLKWLIVTVSQHICVICPQTENEWQIFHHQNNRRTLAIGNKLLKLTLEGTSLIFAEKRQESNHPSFQVQSTFWYIFITIVLSRRFESTYRLIYLFLFYQQEYVLRLGYFQLNSHQEFHSAGFYCIQILLVASLCNVTTYYIVYHLFPFDSFPKYRLKESFFSLNIL